MTKKSGKILHEKAQKAFNSAIKKLKQKSRKTHQPLAIWKDGHIKQIYL